MLAREEILWKQKSRIQWLTSSTLNTRFFHLTTIIRRRRNTIDFLKDKHGNWISNREAIGDCFIDHFKSIYTTSHPSFLASLENLIPQCITDEDNEWLCRIPDYGEIKSAVFSLGSYKSSRLDGMPALFYKHYWSIVEIDVVNTVTSFFSNGHMLKAMNHTFLALIPKTNAVSTVHQFWPISLCNVIYKTISKILANRLKQMLPKLISPWQASFVLGRLIQDNSIIAHELFHSMKKKKGKGGYIALKVDMEKAFDKMEWSFIDEVLKCFGFSNKWIGWISQCISTPTFSILLNGGSYGFFHPQRCLRQGDPLSLFLFIMGTEVLSRLLLRAENMGYIHGIRAARGCTPITNLMFVDDLLLFTRSSQDELSAILNCLEIYQSWSGQVVDYQKSSIFFSKNLNPGYKGRLCDISGFKIGELSSKYLGLPFSISRNKKHLFENVVEKINAKTQGWKCKVLSQAAKITLAQLVLSLIPMYSVASIGLPKSICTKIDSSIRKFIWGCLDSGKIHPPISWSKVCKPKQVGGLGIRKAFDFNKALLSKLGWMIITENDSEWIKLLKTKYLRGQKLFKSFSLFYSLVAVERNS